MSQIVAQELGRPIVEWFQVTKPMGMMSSTTDLPPILVCDVGGADFPMAIAEKVGSGAYTLLEIATENTSDRALRLADRISRLWLERNGSPYLSEIEALAKRAGRPGIYYLNVSYEWGCTTAARPSIDGEMAILQRTLDWEVPGIGRHVVAARIANPRGDWISLTWPAFTGVIQAIAPGRFAAAINQPSHRRRSGIQAIGRLLSNLAIWNSKQLQPVHLLRRVFETAPDFHAALRMLQETPVSIPVIFTLAGVRASETATVERLPTEHVTISDAFAANEWRAIALDLKHHAAFENAARLNAMRAASVDWDQNFNWIRWPILNPDTRLANAGTGELMVRGYEAGSAATQTLTCCG